MDIFTTIFNKFGEFLKSVLPTSPFQDIIETLGNVPYLGYLNWFVPVRGILGVFSLFLTAYGLFLLYSIIMRWLKVIGD